MAQIYKIYINESVLILTDYVPADLQDYQEIDKKGFKLSKFYNELKSVDIAGTYLIRTKSFREVFRKIRKSMPLIKAAGGLVSNEENKYLFIFRKGKWDLPKGKLDEGESFRKAAVREVEEECGITITHCGQKLCKTYHVYEMDGEPVMKKTAWYQMRADNQTELVPQLEEDITDARWLAPGDFMMVETNTYPLIRDVIGFAN